MRKREKGNFFSLIVSFNITYFAGLSIPEIAGIAVGGVVLVAALIGCVVHIQRRRRQGWIADVTREVTS